MKKLISLLLAFVMVVSFSACEAENGKENEVDFAENKSGVINLQMRDPDILDPLKTQKQSVRDALLTIYEPLYNITEDFDLEGVLGVEYAFNSDATVLNVKIKEGVLWHNNHIFTADDVVYTVEKIKSTPSSSYYINLEKLDYAQKVGDYEVAFVLKEPYALFIYNLYFPIMHVNTEAETCVGTGPYRFKETDGKQLVLEKNTAWHMGEVKNDGVKFIYMKTTAMAQEAFSSGKIHAVTRDMLDTENFAIKESHVRNIYPIGLFEFIGFNNTRGVFTDSALRQAASNAVDRDDLAVVYDPAVGASFPVMKGSSVFSPIFETVDYGVEYASEIIFSAGWSDIDGDGLAEKYVNDTMEELRVNFIVSNRDSVRVKAAEVIRRQLEKAGFAVSFEVLDIGEYNERIFGGEFDLFLGAVYFNTPYDMQELLKTKGKVNYMGYSSPSMDEALSLFVSSCDIDNSTVAFSKIQSLYASQQPVAGLVFRNSYVLTGKSITGEIAPYPYSPYGNVYRWTIK